MWLTKLLQKRLVVEEMKDPLVIIIMGPQGSGKGTQGELLRKHFGIPLITVGQMFRDEVKKDTELGRKLASYINTGLLVPNDINNEMVHQRLNEPDIKKGYMLDGYPRNLVQAEYLAATEKPSLVLLIDIPKNETLRRLAGRRVCSVCKLNFNIATLDEGLTRCTSCGGSLESRKDDVPEAIKQRLLLYESETKPVIKFYKKQGILIEVDGVGSPRDVFKRILKVIPLIKKHP